MTIEKLVSKIREAEQQVHDIQLWRPVVVDNNWDAYNKDLFEWRVKYFRACNTLRYFEDKLRRKRNWKIARPWIYIVLIYTVMAFITIVVSGR